jgi:hypothetical protein
MKREGKTLLLKFIRRTVNSLTKIYWWNRRNCCFRNQRISLPMSIFSPSHCECVLYQILRAIASKILELTRTGTTPTLDSSYGCREEENVSQPCRHDRIGASDDGAHALVLRIPWSPLSLSLSLPPPPSTPPPPVKLMPMMMMRPPAPEAPAHVRPAPLPMAGALPPSVFLHCRLCRVDPDRTS